MNATRGTLDQRAHQPLVGVLLVACAGIVIDRVWPVPLFAAFFCSVLGFLATLRLGRRAGSIGMLVGILALGAVWHHARWNLFGARDISVWAGGIPRAVQIEGTVAEPLRHLPPMADPRGDGEDKPRARCTLRVRGVREAAGWGAASGRVELSVSGADVPDLQRGDVVRVWGMLMRPRPATNPGEFNFSDFLRARRILAQMQVARPSAIEVVDSGSRWWPWRTPRRAIDAIRARCARLLRRYLSARAEPLASALLLGDRDRMDEQRKFAFLTSGTIHLLSISGLHVGILAAGFLWLGRVLAIGRRRLWLATMLLVLFYAVLTGARPPVVRAAVLICALCGGRLLLRPARSINSLSAAGLVILAMNPASLFQAGTQLSFLAVAVLFMLPQDLSWRRLMPFRLRPSDPGQVNFVRWFRQSQVHGMTWSSRWIGLWWLPWLQSLGGRIWSLFVAGTTVWSASAPLVAFHFHLVTPISLLLNLLLSIPLMTALFSGMLVLMLGEVMPPAARWMGFACSKSLETIELTIGVCRAVPTGYWWSPGPHPAWLCLAYGLLLFHFVVWPSPLRGRWTAVAWTAICIAGLLSSPWFTRRVALAGRGCYTLVDVGHGTSMVVESPGGETFLYDAGRIGPPHVGGRKIAAVLWARGISHLDTVYLSHADADHYNALPYLCERFRIEQIITTPQMLGRLAATDPDRPSALQQLRRAADKYAIPVTSVHAGQRLSSGPMLVDVLHPPQQGLSGTDNALSLVLQVRCHGWVILLPGDLEGPGLRRVLNSGFRRSDVLMAPHHGSPRSDPQACAEWCQPTVVIISGGSGAGLDRTRQLYQATGATVLPTADYGAVQLLLGPGRLGQLRLFRQHSTRGNGMRPAPAG